jgi:hypothetical protein
MPNYNMSNPMSENALGINMGEINRNISNLKTAKQGREQSNTKYEHYKNDRTLKEKKRVALGKSSTKLGKAMGVPMGIEPEHFDAYLQIAKDKTAAGKAKREAVKANIEMMGNAAAGAKNSPESYPLIRAKLIEINPDLEEQLPLEYDENFIDASMGMMMDAKKVLDGEVKEIGELAKYRREHAGKMELEESKRTTKKQGTGSSKDERFIRRKLDLEDKVDNETITSREQKELDLINKSMEKRNQIREGVSERGMTKTNDMMGSFSESVNSTDFFDFSDKIISGEESISNLSTTQKKDLGKIARREQSVTKNRIDKDDKSTLSALKQTTNVIDVMKGSDFTDNYGLVDKYTDDIMKYFRGDENAAKTAMISAFLKAATVNANIKGVPSNADLKLISEGLSDRSMNEDQAAKMMVSALEKDLAEAKDTLDRAIVSAPATAIFKYGDVVSDLKKSISIINQAFNQDGNSPENKIAELRGEPQQNQERKVVRTGMLNGKRVTQYDDGSIE